MIQDNRKRARKRHLNAQANSMQAASQVAINAILWRIIMQNAEDGEDYDPEKDATLTVPKDDLESVPMNFKLQVGSLENGDIIVTAIKPEAKSNIILPEKRIIGG